MAKPIRWITLDNGTHIPIEEGQTKGEAIDNFVYRHRANMKAIRLRADHYSRLKVMFSDYHRGAYKPKEFDDIKLFDLDKTMFLVVGEYPYMVPIGSITYKTQEEFDEAWEEEE
jgi:hypothetical protein